MPRVLPTAYAGRCVLAVAVLILALLAALLPASDAHAQRGGRREKPAEPTQPGDWLAEYTEPEDGVETRGRLTYRLSPGNDRWPPEIRVRIIKAMDEAVWLYNRYGLFEKQLLVAYDRSVPTANANYAGRIKFGKSISTRVALHEIQHTLGVGTQRAWGRMLKDKKWTGHHANRLLQSFDGRDARLNGDRQHFWPYGLNYDKGDNPTNRVRHILMVEALCRDMGLRVFLKEPPSGRR
ncbi:MAG: hypothetical protein AAF790_04840 [Planctomycetota bacterium]